AAPKLTSFDETSPSRTRALPGLLLDHAQTGSGTRRGRGASKFPWPTARPKRPFAAPYLSFGNAPLTWPTREESRAGLWNSQVHRLDFLPVRWWQNCLAVLR